MATLTANVPASTPLLFDLKEGARRASLSTKTLRRLYEDGMLPPGTVVRVRRRVLLHAERFVQWINDGCPVP